VRAAPPAQLSGFTFEFGSRIWYSTGKLAKDLFDDPRSSGSLNSRLTYGNLTATSFEAFGRADSPAGVFLKGFLGLGNLNHGFLDDEDFPPAIEPYSSTLSQQQGGQIRYGAVDIGQTLWRSPRASFGVFAGYGLLTESTNAFGCTQIAGNPFVCVPTIPSGVLGISEGTRWQFARLGFAGEVRLLDRLKFSGEFAWLPFAQVVANDIHWLRIPGRGACVLSAHRLHQSGDRRALLGPGDARHHRLRGRHRRLPVYTAAAAAQLQHRALRRLRARQLQIRAAVIRGAKAPRP